MKAETGFGNVLNLCLLRLLLRLKSHVFHPPYFSFTGICGLYERKLKEINPTIQNITYDISDLYNFIDGLADLSALIFDHSIQAYLPYDRLWIKHRMFQHLKRLASH
ncbi:hypothetical protein C4D60_Mb04t12460 [Musa balbisiana]|uniref:Enhancer of rudimentary homolog n=1 Tax=Musa balbisiana TaxID=52838 RepID=A0A4S8KBL0_MUSBA|nr:hypothetical protein C4D60_Mb04t12460 [Musa balbisiana]